MYCMEVNMHQPEAQASCRHPYLLATQLVLFTLLAASVAAGQVITGTIVGTVTDNTGAVLPGARITASNVDTGTEAGAISNATGDYTINLLRPGSYVLTAQAEGFQT